VTTAGTFSSGRPGFPGYEHRLLLTAVDGITRTSTNSELINLARKEVQYTGDSRAPLALRMHFSGFER
jgi:hypothetical protein